ncbi:MAG: UDP-N-acetylglucosamine 1-carboxyvinyltransferase [Patescibacteria group bacterium]
MLRLIIKGGRKLKGEWRLSGNKNEALALIAASLLFEDGLVLKNVPRIKDVEVMTQIADFLKKQKKSKNPILPAELSSKIRGSLLFMGPLLALTGKAIIPRSGGDKIGLRKIDTHLEIFKAFGAITSNNKIILPARKLQNGREVKIWLSEPSVTATENALMLSALRPAKTTIRNAASEPHVVGLGSALKKGGAKIKGLGTNFLEIRGVKNLKKVSHELKEDFMELGSILVLSAIFGGKIKIKTGNTKEYEKIFEAFEKFGEKVVQKNGFLKVARDASNDFKKEIQEISDGPWPNFPSDLISPMIVLATQCRGQYLFHEKMFESRLYFIDQLKNMGAKAILCDPHRVLVSGPSLLHSSHMASPDIRAGMALVIAALAAKGTSIIDNAEQIDRGYENLVEKLKNLGADIKRE